VDIFIVTRNWIFDNRTARGSWNKPQIEALGLTWPPKEGWIDKLDGTAISNSSARQFEQMAKYQRKVRKKKWRYTATK